MRLFVALALATVLSGSALAAAPVKPASLPTIGMNGQPNGTWDMAAQKNAVFVFEAMMNFCGACNSNAPLVDQMATRWKSEPRVQVLDLSLDRNPRELAQWMAKHKPNHTVLNDASRVLYNQMSQENAIPQTFVVDCKGVMHEATIGGWDSSTIATLNAAITEALQVTCE